MRVTLVACARARRSWGGWKSSRVWEVYALPATDTREKTLRPIIRRKIRPDSVVYTDGHPSYNVLDVSEFHHLRINHAQHFANGKKHINGIENFWNQAKRWLRRYNGIPRRSFPLFLKEVQLRFNYGSPQQQLKTLRAWCKSSLIYDSP